MNGMISPILVIVGLDVVVVVIVGAGHGWRCIGLLVSWARRRIGEPWVLGLVFLGRLRAVQADLNGRKMVSKESPTIAPERWLLSRDILPQLWIVVLVESPADRSRCDALRSPRRAAPRRRH